MSSPNSEIDSILARRKIVILCGTGGVGKTTLSAAVAIRACLLGKKTAVITIDPAKRLATALGLEKLGDEPTDLTPFVSQASGDRTGMGTLHAIVPDTRHTFESFVHSIAKSEAMAERIIRNPIFQVFAKEFSGTNEYMALEKLRSLVESAHYDCIVLDTPPSDSMLDFLEAPGLLSRLFEEKLIRWLAVPVNRIMAIGATGVKIALGALEKLTGSGFMTHLVDFSSSLFEVQTTFNEHLKSVIELLRSEDVGTILVSSPALANLEAIQGFLEAIQRHEVHFEGIVLNRTLSSLKNDVKHSGLNDSEGVSLIQALQRVEAKILAEIQNAQIPLCAQIPELARDVHSTEDLLHVALALANPALG